MEKTNTERKSSGNRWGLGIASVVVFAIVAAFLFNPDMLNNLKTKGAGFMKKKGEVIEEVPPQER